MSIPIYSNIDLKKNLIEKGVIESGSEFPSNPIAGQLFYDTTTNKLCYYNGTEWTSSGGGEGTTIEMTETNSSTSSAEVWYTTISHKLAAGDIFILHIAHSLTPSDGNYNSSVTLNLTDSEATVFEGGIYRTLNLPNSEGGIYNNLEDYKENSYILIVYAPYVDPLDTTHIVEQFVSLQIPINYDYNTKHRTSFPYNPNGNDQGVGDLPADFILAYDSTNGYYDKIITGMTIDFRFPLLYNKNACTGEELEYACKQWYKSYTDSAIAITDAKYGTITGTKAKDKPIYLTGTYSNNIFTTDSSSMITFGPISTNSDTLCYVLIGYSTDNDKCSFEPDNRIFMYKNNKWVQIGTIGGIESPDGSIQNAVVISKSDYDTAKNNNTLLDKTIYDIKDDTNLENTSIQLNGIMQMPSQISTWAFSGTTPTDEALTTYMIGNTTLLDTIVNNGILLSTVQNTSGTKINYIFALNYTVDTGVHSYDFYCLTDYSKSFYIYYNGTKYMWNRETACLIGSTKVHTRDGLKEIKDIKKGDEVLSYNFDTEQEEFKKVNNIVSHTAETLYDIKITNNINIVCTYDEPIYSFLKNVVLAKYLRNYDKLFTTSNFRAIIEKITIKKNVNEVVYDLSVKDNFNFFVTENKILVATEKNTKKEK